MWSTRLHICVTRVLPQSQQLFRQLEQNYESLLLQSALRNIFQTGTLNLYQDWSGMRQNWSSVPRNTSSDMWGRCCPYCTMARSVQAFRNGGDNVKDKRHTVYSVSAADQHRISSLQELLTDDRCSSSRNLPDMYAWSLPWISFKASTLLEVAMVSGSWTNHAAWQWPTS